MNFEEKVLTMLAEMQATQVEQGKQLTAIDSRLTKVEATQTEQGKQLAELTDKVDSQQSQLSELAANGSYIKSQVSDIDDRLVRVDSQLRKVAVTQETQIDKLIHLLDEDYSRASKQPRLTKRVDSLESDLKLVQNAVKDHTQRIAILEKAN